MCKKRGQSILEYVLVLTVIIVAIAIAANNFLRPAVDKAINTTSKLIENATDKLAPK
jgi:uncharacterized protein (UPF0333 family)